MTTSVVPQMPTPQVFFKSGNYHILQPGITSTSAALGNNVLRLAPLVIPEIVTFTRIGAEVTIVGDAGSTFTIAIFSDLGAANHLPGVPLYDSSASGSASTILANGKIAGDSATVQEITVNWMLAPGIYWIGGVLQGAPSVQPTFRCPPGVAGWGVGISATLPGANAGSSGFFQSAVSGALPNPFVSAGSTSATIRTFAKVQ